MRNGSGYISHEECLNHIFAEWYEKIRFSDQGQYLRA